MRTQYVVSLTAEERNDLLHLISSGRSTARVLTRARILLLSDSGAEGPSKSYNEIHQALGVSISTSSRIRKRFTQKGVEAALKDKVSSRVYERILDGDKEARLIKIACGSAPSGRDEWTLELLADKLVELKLVDSIHPSTVHRTLKKNELKPWLIEQYCIPPKANAGFVACMEDVLDVYKRPYDPDYPIVCMDEKAKQVLVNIRDPLPVKPGMAARQDSEYKRNGNVSVFIFVSPLDNWRRVSVRDQRTRKDWAEEIRKLVDEDYPDVEKIVLVMDNLNTHTTASLYATFPPAEARRLASKLEIHYTPIHGSWLNMAEIELSVLSRQCLGERMKTKENIETSLAVWCNARNEKEVGIDWRFTTDDARIKLRKLYPSFHVQ